MILNRLIHHSNSVVLVLHFGSKCFGFWFGPRDKVTRALGMGNVFCHPRAECPVNSGELVIQNVNSMHHRRLLRWKVKTLFPLKVSTIWFHISKLQSLIQQSNRLTFQWPAKRRRIPIQPDILQLPKLHDFTGETSKQLRAKCFEDPDFPATNASIGGVTGDHANPNVAKYLEEMMKLIVPGWVRPVEMIGKEAGVYQLFATEGEPCLFKRVSPRDIEQGYLGNCWLVAAMSTLAEYPDRVRSLFKQKTLSEDGRYDVRLYDPRSEEWKLVTIDDRLPYWQRPGKHGNICFTKQTKENEFWPCLLEKAVAKFVMAYYRLDGGFSSVGMEMFTGKPSVCMHVDSTPENPEGPHVPFSLVTGETWETSKHATVLLRKDTFDLGWGYWGQDASSLVGGKTEFSDDALWKQLKEWDDLGYSQSGGSRTDYKGILASSLDQRVPNESVETVNIFFIFFQIPQIPHAYVTCSPATLRPCLHAAAACGRSHHTQRQQWQRGAHANSLENEPSGLWRKRTWISLMFLVLSDLTSSPESDSWHLNFKWFLTKLLHSAQITKPGQVKSVLRLLHVRNPHATNEWFGRFNDADWETWHAYPEALEATGHKVGFKDPQGKRWQKKKTKLSVLLQK